MTENTFADHPKSVAEVRAIKAESAALWTPRDVLIHVLRMIDDETISPDHLIVCYRKPLTQNPDGSWVTDTFYSLSGKDPHVTLGILERVKFEITGR